jgi:L-ribulose-5-phosphate 3-epimerase
MQSFPKIGFMQGRLSPMYNNRIQSFPWGNWQNEFRIAAENDFNYLEWTIDTHRFSENPLVTKHGVKEILNISDVFGINIPSVTCDYFMENPPWRVDTEEVTGNLLRIIDGMNSVGANIMVIPLVDNSSIKNVAEREFAMEYFLGLSESLKNAKVRVAFELDFKAGDVLEFIGAFDSELFSINYDIGNNASFGFSPTQDLGAYGDKISNVHVKDRKLGGSSVPLGQGSANFDEVFANLARIKYGSNLILQTARALDEDHLGALLTCKRFIEKCLGANYD